MRISHKFLFILELSKLQIDFVNIGKAYSHAT